MFNHLNRQFYRNYFFFNGIFWTLYFIKQELYLSKIGIVMAPLILIHFFYAFFRPRYNIEARWKLALIVGFTCAFALFIILH